MDTKQTLLLTAASIVTAGVVSIGYMSQASLQGRMMSGKNPPPVPPTYCCDTTVGGCYLATDSVCKGNDLSHPGDFESCVKTCPVTGPKNPPPPPAAVPDMGLIQAR